MSDIAGAVSILVLLVILAVVAIAAWIGYTIWQKTPSAKEIVSGTRQNLVAAAPWQTFASINDWIKSLVSGSPKSAPAPKDNTPDRPDAPAPPGLESLDIFGFKPFASGGTVGDYIGNTGQNRLSWEDYLAKARAIFIGKSDKEIRELYDKSGGVL